ncbi:hypothetical protein HETIRDRAFT_453303 [Heterobasidion irregulare TC 32-1]|uniref:Uncharacterized protein n=1 Tax=Heterobasidion irregulare (strain TC 32-1) TaxID=747525 RepID=W4K036_HETIT|nr:uncharacterized protein HETIRDRAFT_453303 [Heterobasidion irregulare TC 32-1]ETW78700.1 hypothetical protein HETIRDRAFT_453303 [Heterobasidion irregulare TC 32-1]
MALLLASLQAQLGLRSLAQQSYGRLRLASRVLPIHRPSRDPGDDIHLPSAGPASEALADTVSCSRSQPTTTAPDLDASEHAPTLGRAPNGIPDANA